MKVTAEEQALIDELKRLRPDLIVVPREPSAIMLLRASHHGPVFEALEDGTGIDYTSEFMTFKDLDPDPRWDPDPNDYLHEDPREYYLAAAIWRGCISGFEEWQRYREREGSTSMVESWDQPRVDNFKLHPMPEYMVKK